MPFDRISDTGNRNGGFTRRDSSSPKSDNTTVEHFNHSGRFDTHPSHPDRKHVAESGSIGKRFPNSRTSFNHLPKKSYVTVHSKMKPEDFFNSAFEDWDSPPGTNVVAQGSTEPKRGTCSRSRSPPPVAKRQPALPSKRSLSPIQRPGPVSTRRRLPFPRRGHASLRRPGYPTAGRVMSPVRGTPRSPSPRKIRRPRSAVPPKHSIGRFTSQSFSELTDPRHPSTSSPVRSKLSACQKGSVYNTAEENWDDDVDTSMKIKVEPSHKDSQACEAPLVFRNQSHDLTPYSPIQLKNSDLGPTVFLPQVEFDSENIKQPDEAASWQPDFPEENVSIKLKTDIFDASIVEDDNEETFTLDTQFAQLPDQSNTNIGIDEMEPGEATPSPPRPNRTCTPPVPNSVSPRLPQIRSTRSPRGFYISPDCDSFIPKIDGAFRIREDYDCHRVLMARPDQRTIENDEYPPQQRYSKIDANRDDDHYHSEPHRIRSSVSVNGDDYPTESCRGTSSVNGDEYSAEPRRVRSSANGDNYGTEPRRVRSSVNCDNYLSEPRSCKTTVNCDVDAPEPRRVNRSVNGDDCPVEPRRVKSSVEGDDYRTESRRVRSSVNGDDYPVEPRRVKSSVEDDDYRIESRRVRSSVNGDDYSIEPRRVKSTVEGDDYRTESRRLRSSYNGDDFPMEPRRVRRSVNGDGSHTKPGPIRNYVDGNGYPAEPRRVRTSANGDDYPTEPHRIRTSINGDEYPTEQRHVRSSVNGDDYPTEPRRIRISVNGDDNHTQSRSMRSVDIGDHYPTEPRRVRTSVNGDDYPAEARSVRSSVNGNEHGSESRRKNNCFNQDNYSPEGRRRSTAKDDNSEHLRHGSRFSQENFHRDRRFDKDEDRHQADKISATDEFHLRPKRVRTSVNDVDYHSESHSTTSFTFDNRHAQSCSSRRSSSTVSPPPTRERNELIKPRRRQNGKHDKTYGFDMNLGLNSEPESGLRLPPPPRVPAIVPQPPTLSLPAAQLIPSTVNNIAAVAFGPLGLMPHQIATLLPYQIAALAQLVTVQTQLQVRQMSLPVQVLTSNDPRNGVSTLDRYAPQTSPIIGTQGDFAPRRVSPSAKLNGGENWDVSRNVTHEENGMSHGSAGPNTKPIGQKSFVFDYGHGTIDE